MAPAAASAWGPAERAGGARRTGCCCGCSRRRGPGPGTAQVLEGAQTARYTVLSEDNSDKTHQG